jgi:hypothetical protein
MNLRERLAAGPETGLRFPQESVQVSQLFGRFIAVFGWVAARFGTVL